MVLGVLPVFLICASKSQAVTYLRKEQNGVRIFKCKRSYGDVKVFKLADEVYRVISIPFSGELRANSARAAAEAACGESVIPRSEVTRPYPSRNPEDCE